MADHSVVAWNELYESEASWASVFCFDNASSEKSCFVRDLFFLFRYAYEFLYSWMPPEGIEIAQRSPLREKSGSMQFIKTKEVSSRSPRELKFARYIFRLEDL